MGKISWIIISYCICLILEHLFLNNIIKAPVNLLLKTEDGVFWINLPIGFVTSIKKIFKIREDKDVVHLEINAGSNNFLFDFKSGGTGFDFNTFVKEEIFLF